LKYYIVVIDPFDPIYPGWDTNGADLYFVPNVTVKNILLRKKIEEKRVIVSGLPLDINISNIDLSKNNRFIINNETFYVDSTKKTILITCGAQGSIHFLKIVEEISNNFNRYFNIIVICGHNKILYNTIKSSYKDVFCFGYINNLCEIIASVDVCITKSGTNIFHQCLYLKKPILIDATMGLLYQEEGIIDYLKNNTIGDIFYSKGDLVSKIYSLINNCFEKLDEWNHHIMNIETLNGGDCIANTIEDDMNVSNT
jgi:UDP-N-acetylglucosamine:LPS N-acetylglucosamine transferase